MTHPQKIRTLWLVGILHVFTHVYQVALLPLYLPIQREFHLPSKAQATLLVSVMMLSYFLPSYPMGVLADRVSRKKLLGIGLWINALGFLGLGLAPNYPTALACVVASGIGGSFFHPAATALVAKLFPIGTGKALGLLGIGASVGFFAGPFYAGWHAEHSGNWRVPVIILGAAGMVAALLFAACAQDEPVSSSRIEPSRHTRPSRLFPRTSGVILFLVMALCFSLRDFTGNGMGTLGSLFLQQVHGFSVQKTGWTLSAIFIASAISNPWFGRLSDGGRIRWTIFLLLVAAVVVAVLPHLPSRLILPAFVIYGFFFVASYPIVEAALMEAVPDAVRGRVFGLFITVGGLVGNLSHWLIGRWVESFGELGAIASTYNFIYGLLAAFLVLSLLGLACLRVFQTRKEIVSAEHSARLVESLEARSSPSLES